MKLVCDGAARWRYHRAVRPNRFVLAIAMVVTATASAWGQRCPEPKIPVVIRWSGGAATSVSRAPAIRCMNLAEFLAMRRARNAWRCTPPTRATPAQCTAIRVPTQRHP